MLQNLTLAWRVVAYDTKKPFFYNHPKNSTLALAYHDASLFCIGFHFHIYVIKKKTYLLRRGKPDISLHRRYNPPPPLFFFFFAERPVITQLCGKSGVHIPHQLRVNVLTKNKTHDMPSIKSDGTS